MRQVKGRALILADAKDGRRRQLSKPKQKWRAKFLSALRRIPNIEAASREAGIDRSRIYQVRAVDKKFAASMDRALQIAVDKLEKKAFNMAHHGDSQMVSWLLRCHRPIPYDPAQKHQVQGAVAGVIVLPPKEAGPQ